ncbi:MAG: four helix bundle protein [Parcubacteria group bacterium]|nr:four helix bundle protein [Parcubacteria group bacterium]
MSQFNFHNSITPPTLRLLPLLQKTKDAYLLWYGFYQTLPKTHRHSLGQKIDILFVEIIESLATASFLIREEKLPFVRLAIRKNDTLKIFLMMLWETKSISNKKYIAISLKIDEIGRMLGGWNGQLVKQNSPKK